MGELTPLLGVGVSRHTITLPRTEILDPPMTWPNARGPPSYPCIRILPNTRRSIRSPQYSDLAKRQGVSGLGPGGRGGGAISAFCPRVPNTLTTPLDMQHSGWWTNYWVNWWKTHPESPDINLIENLWHELKEFIRRELKKPKIKQQLIDGILAFWNTVGREKCRRNIGHLRKYMYY